MNVSSGEPDWDTAFALYKKKLFDTPFTPDVPLTPDVPEIPFEPPLPPVKDEVGITFVIPSYPPTHIYPSAKDADNEPERIILPPLTIKSELSALSVALFKKVEDTTNELLIFTEPLIDWLPLNTLEPVVANEPVWNVLPVKLFAYMFPLTNIEPLTLIFPCFIFNEPDEGYANPSYPILTSPGIYVLPS